MKIKSVVIFCLITINSFGQQTDEVTKEFTNPWYTEKYSVLKSDKNIKHGNFKKLGYKNCLVIDGFYKNGEKDSLWTNYFWRSKQIEKQGMYLNDQRIGEWKFYSFEGTLLQIYNYSSKQLIYSVVPKTATIVVDNDQITEKKLKTSPQFIGSTVELNEYIFPKQLKVLESVNFEMKSGVVWITFFVDKDGHAINHKIESGISEKVDRQCLEIVKAVPDLWIPGTDENGNVTAMYKLPVKFTIK
jgi:periplasmic protein TonB